MGSEQLSAAEQILKNWNGGILREAKTKLAKELNLPTGNISNWLHGRQEPSEKAVFKMSKILGKSEDEIRKAFGSKKTKSPTQNNIKNRDCQIQQIIGNFEAELIKEKLKTLEVKMDLILQLLQGRK